MALAGAVTSVAACGHDVTRSRVQATFEQTFTRLYLLQLHEQGKREPARVLQQAGSGSTNFVLGSFYTHAYCRKQPRTGAQTGAGDTWVCTESFQRPNGTVAQADYDVNVLTNGCMNAIGPAQVVGPAQIQSAQNKLVVNPLAQFYACFDTT
jgi:hypothetical protein